MSDHEIVRALLTDQKHVRLYHENPWFKTGLDAFVRLLPVVMDGLAVQAEEKNAEMNTMRDLALRGILKPTDLLKGEQ